jgi:hypothetical protein
MNKILIIDDDNLFTDAKVVSWKLNFKLDLVSIDNWKDGVAAIRKNNYEGIILDVKCKKDKQSLPDEKIGIQMLKEVLGHFDKTNSDVPVVVWTNYPNQKEMWQRTGVLETFSRDIKIFTKTEEDEIKLVNLLKEAVGTSNRNFYIKKYDDAYTILQNRISKKIADSFLEFVMELNNDTAVRTAQKYLVPRSLLESILNAIADKFPNLEKAWKQNRVDYFWETQKKQIKFDKWEPINALNWLKDSARNNGIPYSDTINNFFHCLRISTNNFSAHESKGFEKYNLFLPTIYTSKAILYMMLELIFWFEKVMQGEDI